MTRDEWLGIVRHLLTALGGVLVTKGALDEGSLQVAVGSATALVGVVWSVLDKRGAKP